MIRVDTEWVLQTHWTLSSLAVQGEPCRMKTDTSLWTLSPENQLWAQVRRVIQQFGLSLPLYPLVMPLNFICVLLNDTLSLKHLNEAYQGFYKHNENKGNNDRREGFVLWLLECNAGCKKLMGQREGQYENSNAWQMSSYFKFHWSQIPFVWWELVVNKYICWMTHLEKYFFKKILEGRFL